jgi:hypothetical protein
VLHGHDPTNGPEGVHEQQALAESESLILGRESVRSLIPGSQSVPQADVYAEMPGKMVNVAWRPCGISVSWTFSAVED